MKLYEYAGLDATGLAALVRGGEVTAREVAAVATEAIALANPKINAVVETYDDRIATLDEAGLGFGSVSRRADFDQGCARQREGPQGGIRIAPGARLCM